eukprot:7202126-Pyramimonas_sp.AAC.1
MFKWFDDEGVPHDRRLGRLTLKMIGFNACGKQAKASLSWMPHPGAIMATKAAETALLLDFA